MISYKLPYSSSVLIFILILNYGTTKSLSANEPQNTRETLIIVDKTASIVTLKQTHSDFIKTIQDLGQQLTIKAADDSSLKLSKYGEYLFDNIVVFCPQGEVFRGTTMVKDIHGFIDAGRNVLLVGGHAPGSRLSELARGVGFEFKETQANREYTNTKLNQISHLVGDTSAYPSLAFSYSGTQLKMVEDELTIGILMNNAPVDDMRPASASKFLTNVLIGAMQARNNARVLVSGSADFFSDKSFTTSKHANRQLTKELMSWLFKEKSLLRYSDVTHRKLHVEESSPSTDIATKTHFEGYTIMDDIEYSIKIELFENGQWKPYIADDVQLEFVRIDPFVRQTMTPDSNGVYVSRFKVPDVYGVYKFQVDYKKQGLTWLFSSTQVSVRPLRHNEYERYIFSAYPYYLSAFLMMGYLYIFSFVYLYQQKEKRNNK